VCWDLAVTCQSNYSISYGLRNNLIGKGPKSSKFQDFDFLIFSKFLLKLFLTQILPSDDFCWRIIIETLVDSYHEAFRMPQPHVFDAMHKFDYYSFYSSDLELCLWFIEKWKKCIKIGWKVKILYTLYLSNMWNFKILATYSLFSKIRQVIFFIDK